MSKAGTVVGLPRKRVADRVWKDAADRVKERVWDRVTVRAWGPAWNNVMDRLYARVSGLLNVEDEL